MDAGGGGGGVASSPDSVVASLPLRLLTLSHSRHCSQRRFLFLTSQPLVGGGSDECECAVDVAVRRPSFVCVASSSSPTPSHSRHCSQRHFLLLTSQPLIVAGSDECEFAVDVAGRHPSFASLGFLALNLSSSVSLFSVFFKMFTRMTRLLTARAERVSF